MLSSHFAIGPYLGDLTNELEEGRHIVEFVSTGPKSYSYKDSQGDCEVKLKGITKTLYNLSQVNFESMLLCLSTAVVSPDAHDPKTFQARNMVFRTDAFGNITTRHELKVFRMVYNKRFIGPNYITFPFGYKHEVQS